MLSCTTGTSAAEPNASRTHRWGDKPHVTEGGRNSRGRLYVRLRWTCKDCGREWDGFHTYQPASDQQPNVERPV